MVQWLQDCFRSCAHTPTNMAVDSRKSRHAGLNVGEYGSSSQGYLYIVMCTSPSVWSKSGVEEMLMAWGAVIRYGGTLGENVEG